MPPNLTESEIALSQGDKPNDVQTYRRLASYVRSRAWLFVIAIFAFLAASAGEVFFAQILGAVVDSFRANPETNEVVSTRHLWLPDYFLKIGLPLTIAFSLMIGIAATVRAIGTVTGEFLLSRVSFHVVHTIRCELHARLLVLPSSYFDSNKQGALSNRLTDTTSKLRDTVTDVLKILLQDGGKLILMLGYMFVINLYLTMLFLALAPIVAVIVRIASRRFRAISTNIQTSMGEVTHVGQETVNFFKTLRAFGGADNQDKAFQTASEKNRKQHLKLIATKAVSAQFIQLLAALAIAVLVGILFIDQVSGGMTPGQLVTYVGLAGAMASPIKRLSDVNARIQFGLAAATEIFEQIDMDAETDKGEDTLQQTKGAVRFDNVSFRYASMSRPSIQEVSLNIEPGQIFALVGSTGGGKTTLMELLVRFYEPDSGEILIDGRSIGNFTKESLRRQIALVSQEVFLFNDTLRSNITLGELRNASEKQLLGAIQRSRVSEFVERLPKGLDTIVGDRGSNLSQGERQRVLIARAFLKDAPILIFDEATSALDAESEALIQKALADAMKNRTTLVVAHRLSTIENADTIAVMEKGRIVETGSHAELLAKEGRYAFLRSTQFGENPHKNT
ncbi:MAG: ABC transporter transmembrane domain-containing protein [Gammaproteobacteria bacterium]|nr:ABC transporter transmembrane domain-containing protein [Gammaproteobacteria bacterium]